MMATTGVLCLEYLPNEILMFILTPFSTESLLPLVLVSRRFHSIIVRILHYRLLHAAALPEYKLILEAYHPSRKNNEPYLFCTCLRTDGLGSKHGSEGSLYEDCVGAGGRLAKLGSLYSRFRPEKPGVTGQMTRRVFYAGGVPSQESGSAASQLIYSNGGDGGSEKVLHTINLDSHELFTQFEAYASLVTVGPRRGVFLNTVHLVKSREGVMRVWREWLQSRSGEQTDEENTSLSKQPSVLDLEPSIGADPCIMWQDYKRNIGLRVAVKDQQRRFTARPGNDDDLPLSFSVEIKELVIRTTHLMLAVEKSKEEQRDTSGKAMIFGSFAPAR